MHPRVSVVIKSYNHAAFVSETIQSVLDQSFQDFEIVITDDGSTDSTVDVIRGFSDPRIHLQVFKDNRGISHAMNATIARSRGEFIAILNSDDFALPGRLERQVAFLTANSAVAAVFGMPRFIDDRGTPFSSIDWSTADFYQTPFRENFRARGDWLRFFFFHCNCLCAPTAMIRRRVYERVGSYDPRLANAQDLDMWVRICAEQDIHVMREELTAYRVLDGHRNMSAPRRDTVLRVAFEFAQILKRYRTMSPDFLREIFADDLAASGISPAGHCDVWLAELALKAASPAHRLFAIETLFEIAHDDAEESRLRAVTGNVDVLGIWSTRERDEQISRLTRALNDTTAERDEQIRHLTRVLDDTTAERDEQIRHLTRVLNDTAAERDEHIGRLTRAIAQRDDAISEKVRTIQALLHSRSWRYTAALRWLSGLIGV